MDSEFPDPDEEFDLAHEDDYEVLREIEGSRTLVSLLLLRLRFKLVIEFFLSKIKQ